MRTKDAVVVMICVTAALPESASCNPELLTKVMTSATRDTASEAAAQCPTLRD